MYDLIIIGAGPAGISMVVEARAAGISSEKILLLEKAPEHSFTIKKYYPENKLVTANYKGFEPMCTGVLCLSDSSKHQTISYLDEAIQNNDAHIHYSETVHKIQKHHDEQRFSVTTDKDVYETKVVAIAIGILGKPNKPEYKLPVSLKDRILFDITSIEISNADVLVVGGGDSASEYCQYLVQQNNHVSLSYRKKSFARMNDINLKSIFALAERGLVELLFESNIIDLRDADHKPEVHFVEESYAPRRFDFIVYALGGSTPRNFLKTIGIEFIGDTPVVTEKHETNVAGLFLIGDLSATGKGGSIIWAFNSANTAMKKICEDYLACTIDPMDDN